jgi:hypothetical protein
MIGHIPDKVTVKGTMEVYYSNGGKATFVDGKCTYVKYNTGDQIWVEYRHGNYKVIKVHTHDGIIMDESQFSSHPFGTASS